PRFGPFAGDVGAHLEKLALRDVVLPPPASDNVTTTLLPPKGTLTGRVISITGSPLGDVPIDAGPVGKGVHGNTRTNKDGWYRVSLYPGTYRVMVSSLFSAPPPTWSTPVFTAQ